MSIKTALTAILVNVLIARIVVMPNSDSTTDGSLIQFVHFVKLKSPKPIHPNALAKIVQVLFNQQIQSGSANGRFAQEAWSTIARRFIVPTRNVRR